MKRMYHLPLLWVAIIIMMTGSARAQICGKSVALRVNTQGLNFVGEQVLPLIPTEIDIPAVDKVIVDWPLTSDDARVVLTGLTAKLNIRELRFYMGGSALHASVVADVSTKGPVDVHNAYASFGTAECNADVDLQGVQVSLGLKVTTVAGRIQVDITNVNFGLDNQATKIQLNDCAIGTLVTAVVDFLRSHFMESIEKGVESLAKEKIAALIEEKLDRTIAYSGETETMSYAARLESVDTDTSGVELSLGAQLDFARGQIAPCLGGYEVAEPQTCVGVAPRLKMNYPSMFSAGVSEALVNNTLHSIWRSGRLCLDSRTIENPAISSAIANLSGALGQPEGTNIDFSFRLSSAPVLHLSASHGAVLKLTGVMLQVDLGRDQTSAGRVNVEANLAIRVKPSIDPMSNTVTLDLEEISVERFNLLGETALMLDPARLQVYLQNVVVPLLQKRLQEQQLSPAVLSAQHYLVALKQIDVGDGYLGVYLDAYEPGQLGDETAPAVKLVQDPGSLISPRVVQVYVTAADNLTPTTLIRYRHRLDGGTWSELSYSSRVDMVAENPTHQLEIVAVDQKGNTSSNPLMLNFEVDALPPRLSIHSAPASLIGSEPLSVTFSGSDDRSADQSLLYEVELMGVPELGGTPQILESRPYQMSLREATFSPRENGVYKIRVTVQDEAGNVTSADSGFVVEAGGCALSGARPSSLAIFLFMTFLLLTLRRRNHNRCLR